MHDYSVYTEYIAMQSQLLSNTRYNTNLVANNYFQMITSESGLSESVLAEYTTIGVASLRASILNLRFSCRLGSSSHPTSVATWLSRSCKTLANVNMSGKFYFDKTVMIILRFKDGCLLCRLHMC